MRRQKLCRLFIITALSLTIIACNGAGRKILWFSDIHFNPFYDPEIVTLLAEKDVSDWDNLFEASAAHTTLPALGKTANRAMIESTLQEMRTQCPDADFIIFSGDFLTHDFPDTYQSLTGDTTQEGLHRFIDKTIAYIVTRFELYFPSIPVYFCLGNNDTYKEDYVMEENDAFLKNTAPVFADAFFKHRPNIDSFKTQYPVGGYYRVKVPGIPDRQILILNSTFFSEKYPRTDNDPAAAQLDWLEAQLRDSGKKTWIVMHIPPGIDVFATLKANKDRPDINRVVSLIQQQHLARFIDIIDTRGSGIKAVLAGHIHRDSFRLLYTDTEKTDLSPSATILLTVPAISPVYYNNPGFAIITYNPRCFTLKDYETRYIDVHQGRDSWQQGYVFSDAYGERALLPENMHRLWQSLQTDAGKRDLFMRAYDAFSAGEVKEDTFKYYWAAAAYLYPDDYRSIVNRIVWQELYESCSIALPVYPESTLADPQTKTRTGTSD